MNTRVSGRKRGSELCYTLAELMVAIAVSALIVVGSLLILRHVAVVTAENRSEMLAKLQVQYVGFWISEDALQAQSVGLKDPDPEGIGFPLTLTWKEWDGDENKVTYEVEGMVDEMGRNLWRLKRGHTLNGESQGTIVVGEYLDPGLTRCFWDESSDDLLVLEVTARVDRNEASDRYEIQPRALN